MVHAWFGGPGEPSPGKEHEFAARVFLRHPDMRIVGLYRENASPTKNHQPAALGTGRKPAEGINMKWNHVAKSVVLALAVMVATSAFAGSSGNKGPLHLSDAAQINGQAVPAGDYQLRWEGTGDNVEVSVMQGKKVVTKAPAKLVEVTDKFDRDATVVNTTSSTPTVTEVRFAGKKYALVLSGAEKAAMGESTR